MIQLYCGFSGAVMMDQIYLMLYNLVFTSLPPLILGVYDQVAPANLLYESPRLYERSRRGCVYQPHTFWVTMTDALYQSIVIFFLTEAVYHDTDVDIWEFGTTITTLCIVVTTVHICIEIKSWVNINFFFFDMWQFVKKKTFFYFLDFDTRCCDIGIGRWFFLF